VWLLKYCPAFYLPFSHRGNSVFFDADLSLIN